MTDRDRPTMPLSEEPARDDREPTPTADAAADREAWPGDTPGSQGTEGSDDGDPRVEFAEAVDHFRKAANLFFERASQDPALRNAATEAERVLQRIGETAEPVARQVSSELGRLTRRIRESVQGPAPRGRDDDRDPEG
jgi:hypothetical protein